MSIKHTLPFVLALTACGAQQAPIERTEQVPDAIQLPTAVPTPAETITVDQDANATVAPGPVQSTPVPVPVPTVSSLPAPVASMVPDPVVTPVPTPTPTPSAAPQCTQVKSDGTYDYTCGLWILNPLSTTGVCAAHAAELELINQNGTWFNGISPVTIDAQGNITWNGITLGNSGGGTYEVQSTQPGRTNTTVPCYFNAAPAN